MAEPGASATKIVGCHMVMPARPAHSLHRIPNYVGCHADILLGGLPVAITSVRRGGDGPESTIAASPRIQNQVVALVSMAMIHADKGVIR